ncbi:uncharacterized protein [Asterias amurensis]|uniref:uncharacterized protein n=1 Tax=Asterias amurensis TaxID=7602 RepID=UPI003AB57E27
MSALHRAVFAGRVAEVQYLLERRNCDPNSRDQNQRTPLIVCSLSSDNDDMVKACAVILLLKGAQICLSDRLGKNALSWACVRNKVQLVQLFLSDYPNRFQFDLRKRDRDGNTALHLAAREGNTEIVELLFDASEESELHAVVTDRNIRGETPLHLAAKRGNSGVILGFVSVSSDALLSRRGAVDSRSAPKWAKAAMKMAGAVDVNAGSRPLSGQPVMRKSARVNSAHNACVRRPQTVTSTKSKPCPTATSTDISTLFKISEMQISSAWRRPAQAPPTTTTPSVVGNDDKCKRPRSSRSKMIGKGRSRSHSVASRGRPLRHSVVDDIVEEEPCTQQQKQVPLVVVNELPTEGAVKDYSSRHYDVNAASENPVKSSKRSSPLHNTTMSYLPDSLVQGRNFLTPFGGAGMAFQFASRNSSLQSLSSDIPGLLSDTTPAFDRSETVPVITRDGYLAITQMRRSKSEPSLLTAFDQQLTPSKLHDTRYGSKRAYSRKGRPTSRRRGHGKTQVLDMKDKCTSSGRRPTSKVTPIKMEASHYGSSHQIGVDTIAPSVPPTPTPSSRSYRRFTRPAREVELTSQRRRKELEDRIRAIQTDIKRLEKRKKGRSYKPLLPEWMDVNQETTVDELVAAVLHDKKPAIRASKEIPDFHSRDDQKTGQSGMVPDSPQQQPTAPGSVRDHHLSRSDTGYQTKERPQLPYKTRFSSNEKETPNSVYRSVPTLRISRPAQAPSYKQSRSIHKQRYPTGGQPLVDSARDVNLKPRVDLHNPRPHLHNSTPRSWNTTAVSMLPNNNKRPNNNHFSCCGTAKSDTAARNSRRVFNTSNEKLK